MEEFQFRITDSPPPALSAGKGGRTRTNPFDEVVLKSFQEDYASTGEWIEFDSPVDDVKKNIGRIRNAAQWLSEHGHGAIGTEVRHDPTSGRISFRGVSKKPAADGDPADGYYDSGEYSTE